MDNLEPGISRSKERKEIQANPESTYGNFAVEMSASLFDDPAAFFIFHLVIVAEVLRVSEIKSYFSRSPDLLPVVDSVLSGMEEANIVRIKGDEIELRTRFVDFGNDATTLKQFLPNLFRLSAKRVLTNEETNPERRKVRREMVRWFALGDNPAVAAEARAIDLEYKAKMIALQEKVVKGETGPTNGIRFVGIVDCVLESEDFT